MTTIEAGSQVVHSKHGLGNIVGIADGKVTVKFQSSLTARNQLASSLLASRIEERDLTLRGISRQLAVTLSVSEEAISTGDVWTILTPDQQQADSLFFHKLTDAVNVPLTMDTDTWRPTGLLAGRAYPSIRRAVRDLDGDDLDEVLAHLVAVSDLIAAQAATPPDRGESVRASLTRRMDILLSEHQDSHFWFSHILSLCMKEGENLLRNHTLVGLFNDLLLAAISLDVGFASSVADIYVSGDIIQSALEERFSGHLSIHLQSTTRSLLDKVGADFDHPYTFQS